LESPEATELELPASGVTLAERLPTSPWKSVDSRPYWIYEPCMSASPGTLKAGTELFGYAITEVLGKGGMGTVYLAQQLSLNRQVALKVLSAQRSHNPEQVETFLNEARSAGRLNHPNLVLVHSVHADADKNLYAYSMEYVPGITLTGMIEKDGVVGRETALHITYQIAKALGHAHRNGLVHRDVKPNNILIARNMVAKLADLGLVRDQLEGVAGANSKRLSIVGTPEYSAPEQSRNPDRATPASDIYSLGACLYYMLHGRPPFQGDNVIDLIVRAATEPLKFDDSVSKDCGELLDMMLAKNPLDRFSNGTDVVIALDALAKGKPIPSPSGNMRNSDETHPDAAPISVPTTTTESARRRPRRRQRRYR
jgi:eukaryotic-like serine/threonine-protein kinase